MRRRELLIAASGLAVAAAGAARPAGLQALAARRGLRWGSAVADGSFAQADLLALLLHNVGAITPENALKWDATEPEPGRFALRRFDRLLAFARRHHLVLRGHTLVWHQQLPAWVGTLDTAELWRALQRHIQGLVGHGRGQMQGWDVVNEPLDGQGRGLRRNLWLERLGPGYIAAALRWARQADPGARLVINEYGLEGDDPQAARKRQALLALVDELQGQRVPLDAIGLQAHLLAPGQGAPGFASLPAFLHQLARRQLAVEITELDVSDRLLPADTALRDARVALTYDAFLAAVLRQPAVQLITTWGLSDRDSWLNAAFPRADGLPQRPLPYDAQLRAKPALSSIHTRLQQIDSRR